MEQSYVQYSKLRCKSLKIDFYDEKGTAVPLMSLADLREVRFWMLMLQANGDLWIVEAHLAEVVVLTASTLIAWATDLARVRSRMEHFWSYSLLFYSYHSQI